MVAWMLYALAAGVAFSVAAALAEQGLRAGGRPGGLRRARWIWTAAMLATAVVPVVAGLGGWGGAVAWTGSLARAGEPAVAGSSSGGAVDVGLLAVWAAVTLLLLTNMRLSSWTVRRNARSWARGSPAPNSVLISHGFGPGVIGTRCPRIVLPEWATRADAELRAMIMAHEVEHVRARDTGLLLAGVVLAALLPWCLPVWFQLHRLRGAIETDCDARVLTRTGDPRSYAKALVAVAGRRTRSLLPIPALAPARGELERRIRLITAGGSRGTPLRARGATVGLLAAALLAAAIPALLPSPELPRFAFDALREAPRRAGDAGPKEAFVTLSVEPEAAPAPGDR